MKPRILLLALLLWLLPALAAAEVTLTMESWRSDDILAWQHTIIPAFEARHPGIKVVFSPTPPTEYNAALAARLKAGTAGDLIACRPFDVSLDLYRKGYLVRLNDLPGLDTFGDFARSAWTTDDGKDLFAVPMASVIHGFIFNADIFRELGLAPPATEKEFFAVLDKIKAHGKYVPLVMGTADQWEAATMGFQSIGPNRWGGEEGRKALIEGKAKLTDPQYVETLRTLARWRPYLAKGFQAQTNADSQNLFAMGRGAIYPAGSWDIAFLRRAARFVIGAFPPPLPEGASTLYVSDHTDIGMGLNAASKNREAAMKLLQWLTTPEFASLYSNSVPGFFSLSSHPVSLEVPLAAEMLSWRAKAHSTIRNSYQILSRGTPNLENELWAVCSGVVNGAITPEDGAARLQSGLDKWYKPAK